ncbi:MAG TPA: 3'-5' exonuclease, partial [Geminicoccaceae bacterium]|nr:3'-5' exonuclease [Geminicoccaceae bacterium]
WLRLDAGDIKRDPEQPRDEVRIMTVHGAKGLEAPVVFLPDTCYVPQLQDRLLWRHDDGLPLWRPGARERERATAAAYEAALAAQRREQRRLLYVALTRARDRLYVCGWKPAKKSNGTIWYDLVRDGLAALPGVERVAVDLGQGIAGEGLRLASRQATARSPGHARRAPPTDSTAPDWLHRPAAPEPAPSLPLSPSRPDEDEPPAGSPLAAAGRAPRVRRGRIVHRLLQSLPDRPPAEWDAAMARFLARPVLGVDGAAERAAIAGQVRAVLEAPELAGLFGPGSRAEVPLTGVVGGRVVAGQVDRLALTDDGLVLVADYKTDRDPPADGAGVPAAYLRQMAAYRAVLRRIYPGRTVRCALVWTEGARLVRLDDALLDAHAPT